MNKFLIIAVVVLLAIGAWWLFTQEDTMEVDELPMVDEITEEATEEVVVDDNDEVSVSEETDRPESDVDHVFVMEGIGREFIVDGEENPELTVAIGDTVRVEFTVTGGRHDFVIDELDVATEVLSVGETEVVEFVATEVGSFEYYCSVGTHRADGMFGTFTVVE